MKTFEELMHFRFRKKKSGVYRENRKDKNGHIVNFLLTYEEFKNLFTPYKDDPRLYLNGNHRDYLCICRYGDVGDYSIDNVYVDTRSNNSKHCHENRQDIFGKDNRSDLMRGNLPNWEGRKHDEESKIKMSQTHIERGNHIGEKNSQYGTCWIFNIQLKENKKIPLDELSYWEMNGWSKGRKMTFH